MIGKRELVMEKRDQLTPAKSILIPIALVGVALLFSAVFMAVLGFDPLAVYMKMAKGAFGSLYGISESILQAIPMMICALGVAIAFKMNISNIGGEGQFTMGAMAAAGVAIYMPGIPDLMKIPIMILVGFAAGAAWGAVSITPKVLWNVNETIVTLMFNYIAILMVDFLVYGQWRDNGGTNLAVSRMIPESAKMGTFFGTRIHAGLFIAIAAAVLIWVFFNRTSKGYQIRVIGENQKAARFAGINIKANMFLVMILSGGIAGIAGMSQVSGLVGRLEPNIANGVGFTAIIIAYLSKLSPVTIVIVSILFGGLTVGGYSIQLLNVPSQVVTMIQGVILLFVLSGEIFTRYRFVWRKKESELA